MANNSDKMRQWLSGERCPICGRDENSVVTDSRVKEFGRRRRRTCNNCGHRWWTVEIADDLAGRLLRLTGGLESIAARITAAQADLRSLLAGDFGKETEREVLEVGHDAGTQRDAE